MTVIFATVPFTTRTRALFLLPSALIIRIFLILFVFFILVFLFLFLGKGIGLGDFPQIGKFSLFRSDDPLINQFSKLGNEDILLLSKLQSAKLNMNASIAESRARVSTDLYHERIFVRLGFGAVVGLRIVRDLANRIDVS